VDACLANHVIVTGMQVPTEGFAPVEGQPVDDSPLTVGVACLMSYERTGDVLALLCGLLSLLLLLFHRAVAHACPNCPSRLYTIFSHN
jgi:hypothetical protein